MRQKKLLSLLLSFVLIASMFPIAAFAATADDSEQTWEISKSKTATNLDENYESNVVLSLPSSEEQLVTDVVFVLDKSTSAEIAQQALDMLSELKSQVEQTSAKVKVGVVIFNKEAHSSNWMDLETEYDDISTAIQQKMNSGTNTHAGLLAGKAMLDSDTKVAADRKYLIFVSDGITYLYNSEPTVTSWGFSVDGSHVSWSGPDNWKAKYNSNNPPAEWDTWLSTVAAQAEKQGTKYDYPYGGTATETTPVEEYTVYNNSIDKALYLTYQTYQDAQQAGYHCYSVVAYTKSNKAHPWGPSFMQYLADGKTVSFDAIKNDILYLVGAGSTVKDTIGYVENDYDFELKSVDSFQLTVGGETLPAHREGNVVQWGEADQNGTYPYSLTYHPGQGAEEYFELLFNVPITNFAQVQLSYTVVLKQPKTEAGTYGQYDADGSKQYSGLYTNNSAILYPVSSAGVAGRAEEFAKPTVSYTVTVPTEYTLSIPYTKYIEQTGTLAPGKETFTLELFGAQEGAQYEMVNNRIETDGVGAFHGDLVCKVADVDSLDLLSEGFYVREVNQSLSGWSYSDAVWFVQPNISDSNTSQQVTLDGCSIYPVVNGEPQMNHPVNMMEFTNSYGVNSPQGEENPHTGDSSSMFFWLFSTLACAAAIVVVARRSKAKTGHGKHSR